MMSCHTQQTLEKIVETNAKNPQSGDKKWHIQRVYTIYNMLKPTKQIPRWLFNQDLELWSPGSP